MQSDARQKRLDAVSTHPLVELLACPPATSSLLTASAQSVSFAFGDTVFGQSEPCRGLYLVVSGQFLRRAERLSMRVTLGMARSGDLVELAAALGDRVHTYTLIAQTAGTVLLLPIDALHQAFQSYRLRCGHGEGQRRWLNRPGWYRFDGKKPNWEILKCAILESKIQLRKYGFVPLSSPSGRLP